MIIAFSFGVFTVRLDLNCAPFPYWLLRDRQKAHGVSPVREASELGAGLLPALVDRSEDWSMACARGDGLSWQTFAALLSLRWRSTSTRSSSVRFCTFTRRRFLRRCMFRRSLFTAFFSSANFLCSSFKFSIADFITDRATGCGGGGTAAAPLVTSAAAAGGCCCCSPAAAPAPSAGRLAPA